MGVVFGNHLKSGGWDARYVHVSACETVSFINFLLEKPLMSIFRDYIALCDSYICSKLIGVDDEDALTDILPSTSTNVNLSLIFLATTFEFSISF